MNVLSLFDGISCGRVALERAGIKVDKYYSSEIDKYAIQIADKNYPQDTCNRLGDVTKWREWDINWCDIDLLIGGSPCQSLSIIQSKTRKNLDGKSKLFFEYIDILENIKKFNPNVRFLFENVASMNKESKDTMSALFGFSPVMLDSNLVSAQDRKRLYWYNWNCCPLEDKGIMLKDIVINAKEVPEKYWYDKDFVYHGDNEKVQCTLKIKGHDILKRVYNLDGKVGTLTCCNGGNLQKKVFQNGRCRKLTPTEYELLQTLPKGYTLGFADIHRYNGTGNGWTVAVIAHILSFIQEEG